MVNVPEIFRALLGDLVSEGLISAYELAPSRQVFRGREWPLLLWVGRQRYDGAIQRSDTGRYSVRGGGDAGSVDGRRLSVWVPGLYAILRGLPCVGASADAAAELYKEPAALDEHQAPTALDQILDESHQ